MEDARNPHLAPAFIAITKELLKRGVEHSARRQVIIHTRVNPNVSGLAAWSENYKGYSH
jgi:hypothetical protein